MGIKNWEFGDSRLNSLLVLEELSGNLEIALLVGVLHARSVHPLAGPLHRFGQIHGVFNHARVDQALTILAQRETFRQPLLGTARQ